MYRFIRHTGKALTAVVLLIGMATACSGSPATSKAPRPRKATGSAVAPTTQPTSLSGQQRLDEEARDLLGRTDLSDPDDEYLVSSGSLAIPGQNVDDTVESGVALRVEVACAGEGTVTFTALSGTARKAERVDCTQTMTNRFDFTTTEPSLTIQADSSEAEKVGTAYVVRRVT
ncbi:hypothetical protein ABZ871_10195 [Streptomyces populi]